LVLLASSPQQITAVNIGRAISKKVALRSSPLAQRIIAPTSVKGPQWLSGSVQSVSPQEWEIHLEGVTPADAGAISESLQVATDAGPGSPIQIPLLGSIRGNLSAVPASVVRIAASANDVEPIICKVTDQRLRHSLRMAVDTRGLVGGNIRIIEHPSDSATNEWTFQVTPVLDIDDEPPSLRGELRFVMSEGEELVESVRVPIMVLIRPLNQRKTPGAPE
jgi:hypothetical protein